MNRMIEGVVKPLLEQLEGVRAVKRRLANDEKIRVVITAIDPDREDSQDVCEVVTARDMDARDYAFRDTLTQALDMMEANLVGDIRGYDPEYAPQPAR